MTDETRFRRANQDTVHVSTCRYASSGVPWNWAEHQSLAAIAAVVAANGLRACKVCKPLEGPL